MTIRFDELPEPPDPPTISDMLAQLCERQKVEICRLKRELAESDASNLRLANELTDASRERAGILLCIQDQLAAMKAKTSTVISQRDTLEKALRMLVHLFCVTDPAEVSSARVEEMRRGMREARELLAVIDQLKAAAGDSAAE